MRVPNNSPSAPCSSKSSSNDLETTITNAKTTTTMKWRPARSFVQSQTIVWRPAFNWSSQMIAAALVPLHQFHSQTHTLRHICPTFVLFSCNSQRTAGHRPPVTDWWSFGSEQVADFYCNWASPSPAQLQSFAVCDWYTCIFYAQQISFLSCESAGSKRLARAKQEAVSNR